MLNYRRDIDGLRAVAVLPVVLFHFGATFIPGGFTGVDIFFVISGYLISGTLLSDLNQNRFSIVNFYWRRFRRILPALIVTLLVSTAAAYVILLPADFDEFSLSLISSATFWSNIYFWRTTNYFATESALRPLLHTWSLSVEEQYYIFAPFLILVVHRWLGRRWFWSLTPIILASFTVSVLATSSAPTAGFYLLPTRIWELMLGALLMLHRFPTPRSRAAAEIAGFAGLGLCAAGFLLLSDTDPFPGANALYPCLGAVLLIYAGQGAAEGRPVPLATRLLTLRPLVGVGLISYSLYLVHWPIQAFARYLSLEALGPGASAAMIAASLALATLSWRFVEQPFRHARALGRRGPVFALSGAALGAVVALGVVGIVGNGLPGRFPGYRSERIEVGDWHWGTCFNRGIDPLGNWDAATCRLSDQHARKVLLWGDSFAAHYVPGLASSADLIEADVIQYTYAGCPPDFTYRSYARLPCTAFNENVLKVIREMGVDAVVMSARWADYESRGFAGLQKTIDRLRALGLSVTVIGQSPQFIADVGKLDYFLRESGVTHQTGTLALGPKLNRKLQDYTLGATFIDPLPYLCSGNACRYAGPEGYYFSDYGHFSPIGAKRAITLYWPRFAATRKEAAAVQKP